MSYEIGTKHIEILFTVEIYSEIYTHTTTMKTPSSLSISISIVWHYLTNEDTKQNFSSYDLIIDYNFQHSKHVATKQDLNLAKGQLLLGYEY